jgi:hypothetical protein
MGKGMSTFQNSCGLAKLLLLEEIKGSLPAHKVLVVCTSS